MSKFLYHTNCERCGSKDNLGVWDDGHKWCFGCKYSEFAPKNAHSAHKIQQKPITSLKSFPEDASNYIPSQPLRWLFGNSLTYESIKDFGIKWSPSQQLLCWRIFGISGKELGWQGRCFSSEAKTKYFGQGQIHSEPCILGYSLESDIPFFGVGTLVLCEDYMSAIRISRYTTAMPLFGCTINLELLQEVKKRFTSLLVWLDADKLDNARKIGLNASLLGIPNQVIYTVNDPKSYTNIEIQQILQNMEKLA